MDLELDSRSMHQRNHAAPDRAGRQAGLGRTREFRPSGPLELFDFLECACPTLGGTLLRHPATGSASGLALNLVPFLHYTDRGTCTCHLCLASRPDYSPLDFSARRMAAQRP